jgi:hypothetical protein
MAIALELLDRLYIGLLLIDASRLTHEPRLRDPSR